MVSAQGLNLAPPLIYHVTLYNVPYLDAISTSASRKLATKGFGEVQEFAKTNFSSRSIHCAVLSFNLLFCKVLSTAKEYVILEIR